MHPESLLLVALFSLAAVAFIGVLNARGVGRTVTAALLALFCLGAALWSTAAYRASRLTEALAVTAAAPDSNVVHDATTVPENPPGGSLTGVGDLAELTSAARSLRDSMAAEDPGRARALSDSEYQAFDSRAGGYLTRARMLRERAARLAAAPPSGTEEAAEFLTLALQALNASARDLQSFFRATDRSEEQRFMTGFRRGVDAAEAPLRSAESRLSTVAPDFEAPAR